MISRILLAIERDKAKRWIKNTDKNCRENTYIFDDDGEQIIIHASGTVDISNNKFEKIPFKFGSINGSFIANNCDLHTLVNSPFEVKENYSIQGNLIKTLAGCPEYVGKNFDISNNFNLTTFASGPETVIANYITSEFPHLKNLKSLKTKFGRFSHIINNKKFMLSEAEFKYKKVDTQSYIFQSSYDEVQQLKVENYI